MEPEKIYYSIVILISALSILLSPFFYIRRGKRPAQGTVRKQWKIVAASNIIVVLILIAAWWFWLR